MAFCRGEAGQLWPFLSTFLPPLPFLDLSSRSPPILAVVFFCVVSITSTKMSNPMPPIPYHNPRQSLVYSVQRIHRGLYMYVCACVCAYPQGYACKCTKLWDQPSFYSPFKSYTVAKIYSRPRSVTVIKNVQIQVTFWQSQPSV